MIKKIFLAVTIIVALLVVDLYTFELILQDPGYYVTARRSDTPDQVLNAIDRMKMKEVTRKQLNILLNRYQQKANSSSIPEKNQKKWSKAQKKITKLLNNYSVK